MTFNPDPSKHAQKVIFFRKRHNLNHDSIYFNQPCTKSLLYKAS